MEPSIVHYDEGATWEVPGVLLLQLLKLGPNFFKLFLELL